MSNKDNHNDPLERLFKKKAEEYDISYREEDWLKLEKQLDARDLKLYYRRRFRWLAAASVLILSLIGYYTLQNHNKIDALTEQLNRTEQIQQNNQETNSITPDPALSEEQTETNQTEIEEDSSVLAQTPEQPDRSSVVQPNESEDPMLSESSDLNVERTGNESGFEEAGNRFQRNSFETSQEFQANRVEPFLLRSDDLLALFHENENDGTYDLAAGNGQRLALLDTIEDDELTDLFSASQTVPISPDHQLPSSQGRKTIGSRFAVGITISPDLSTAGGFSNFDTPGFKGGVLAEYAISENISIISGLALSNVKYRADGSAYNPPQAWNYGVMPDRTKAICLVLDIPINIKANLFNFSRSRIFATTGLSSYIMMNEDYQFRYDGTQQGLQRSWNDATGTRHWFSNAGLSLGFEYDLSNTFSIRAEPHIKVPLKGVGWGEVDLYSIGTFVSLNYRFSAP